MATYFFKDTTSYSISDPDNWYYDAALTTPASLVPNFSSDSVVIGDDSTSVRCDIDSNITVGLGQAFIVTANASVYVGIASYSSILVISGQLEIYTGGYFYVTSNGDLVANGPVNVYGLLNVDAGGYVVNTANLVIYGTFNIQSTGVFINANGATLNTNFGGTTQMAVGATISLSGSNFVYNYGAMTNSTTVNIPSATTFVNIATGSIVNGGTGVFIINNSFQNQGTFSNSGSAINLNQFNNTGNYINATTTTNNGIFSTSDAGFFSHKASSNFTNNNVFILGSSYTTYFKGKVFPQIPSSAAFGTAILF